MEHKGGEALLFWHEVANFPKLLQLRHVHSKAQRHVTSAHSFSRNRYSINIMQHSSDCD